jgi:subtilisin family serine protease
MKSRPNATANLLIAFLFVMFVALSGCSESTAPQQETLSSFRLSAPALIAAGETVSLTVEAVGDQGTRPFTEFNGDVTLTASVGSLTPDVVAVTNGRATVDITLSAAEGVVQVSASGANVDGSISIDITALTALPGDPGGLAVNAIPDLEFAPRAEDYRENAELGGISTSFNTIIVMFDPGATIAEVNALLDDIDAKIVGGVPTTTTGVVMLRVNSSTHDALSLILGQLNSSAAIKLAIQDAKLETTMIPNSNNGSNPPNWVWESRAFGGNWGLEISRVPQAWNLYEALLKRGNTTTTTGIFDAGFFAHDDLTFGTNFAPFITHDHGTHVAGTIAGDFGNGKGVDGVTPFADLVVYGSILLGTGTQLQALDEMASAGARVINMSIGISWTNPADNAAIRAFMSVTGRLFKFFHDDLRVVDEPPLIVAAAGNESKNQSPPIDARYSGGAQWAGLELGSDHVIVVEAIRLASALTEDTRRADFSNGGGDVSAPGFQVLSTVGKSGYELFNGTSMAAPHVTGLVSYLITIDPTLSNAEIKELIKENAVPVTDQTESPANRMDAFASALDIDFLRGTDTVLRMLVDIDDGTADGNLRVRPGTSTDFILDDADGDGGIGDGSIDMSDFRRWRDWFHQIDNTFETTLDGSASHPKRDINGNGKLEEAALEGIDPRGDFNGDGRLHPTDAVPVAGVFAGLGPQSDLDVLGQLFADPFYSAEDLPNLVYSGDLHIDLSQMIDSGNFVEVASRVTTFEFGEARFHTRSDPKQIYTLTIPREYKVEVWGIDSFGDTTCVRTRTVELKSSEDVYWAPKCTGVHVEITLAERIEAGTESPLLIRAGVIQDDGSVLFQANIDIAIAVTGGSVALAGGTTDADGFFSTEVTMGVNSQQMNVFVTATGPITGETAVAHATALPFDSGGEGIEIIEWVGTHTVYYEGEDDGTGNVRARTIQDGDSLTFLYALNSTRDCEEYPEGHIIMITTVEEEWTGFVGAGFGFDLDCIPHPRGAVSATLTDDTLTGTVFAESEFCPGCWFEFTLTRQ